VTQPVATDVRQVEITPASAPACRQADDERGAARSRSSVGGRASARAAPKGDQPERSSAIPSKDPMSCDARGLLPWCSTAAER